jgi:hypothetical protein
VRPVTHEALGRRIVFLKLAPDKNKMLSKNLKITKARKNWGYDSRDRVLSAGGPEFKPQYAKKKKIATFFCLS